MKIVNTRTGEIIAWDAMEAVGFFGRLKGLMGKNSMPAGSALVLKPCNSIHTFFMRFSTDILFLDRVGKVVRLIREMPPARVSPIVRGAAVVMELPGGSAVDNVVLGDVLRMEV